MAHQGDALLHTEPVKECIQKASMLDEGVGSGTAGGQLLGVAHADEVGRDTTAQLQHMGDDVAPEVRRGGITMQKDDRVALAFVYRGYAPSQYLSLLLLIGKCCADHSSNPFFRWLSHMRHDRLSGSLPVR